MLQTHKTHDVVTCAECGHPRRVRRAPRFLGRWLRGEDKGCPVCAEAAQVEAAFGAADLGPALPIYDGPLSQEFPSASQEFPSDVPPAVELAPEPETAEPAAEQASTDE